MKIVTQKRFLQEIMNYLPDYFEIEIDNDLVITFKATVEATKEELFAIIDRIENE